MALPAEALCRETGCDRAAVIGSNYCALHEARLGPTAHATVQAPETVPVPVAAPRPRPPPREPSLSAKKLTTAKWWFLYQALHLPLPFVPLFLKGDDFFSLPTTVVLLVSFPIATIGSAIASTLALIEAKQSREMVIAGIFFGFSAGPLAIALLIALFALFC